MHQKMKLSYANFLNRSFMYLSQLSIVHNTRRSQKTGCNLTIKWIRPQLTRGHICASARGNTFMRPLVIALADVSYKYRQYLSAFVDWRLMA